MYDNNYPEEQADEGWIALSILAAIVICGALLFWEPNVEHIGEWVHAHFFSAQ